MRVTYLEDGPESEFKNTCDFCKYFSLDVNGCGECRRHPPGMYVDSGVPYVGFPPTDEEHWCGDFIPRLFRVYLNLKGSGNGVFLMRGHIEHMTLENHGNIQDDELQQAACYLCGELLWDTRKGDIGNVPLSFTKSESGYEIAVHRSCYLTRGIRG